MRRISVERIQGTEILAKDIYDNMGTILMTAGITIKKEYKQRLSALGVRNIYVEDDLAQGVEEETAIEDKVTEQYQHIMHDVLEKYLTSGSGEFDRLKIVSREVISDIMKKPQVMYNIEGIRNKSESMYSHSVSVCTMSVMLALRYGLSRKKVEEIAIGSLLHDIGFSVLGINDGDYSYDSLSERDLQDLKKHVITGYEIVEKESWIPKEAKEIILSHHERLDRSGYPMRLPAEKLGIGTRIVAVCDEFDRRVYGHFTMPSKIYQAFEQVILQSGRELDAEVIKIFYESVAAYPNGSIVLTNTGETGIVLKQNYRLPMHPIVRILTDADGKRYTDWIEVDLSRDLSVVIEDIIE